MDKVYNVVKAFASETPSVIADVNDIVYTKSGDNNFYLEKSNSGSSTPCKLRQKNNERIYQLDWSLGIKAVRYGWVELVKVENSEQHG